MKIKLINQSSYGQMLSQEGLEVMKYGLFYLCVKSKEKREMEGTKREKN